jgi:uncharacterized protein DUF3631
MSGQVDIKYIREGVSADEIAFGDDPELLEALDKAVSFIRRFVVMSNEQAATVALWVAHTHAFDAFDFTPYLFVTSAERESGKSRLKEVCELLVRNPISTSNVSPAALFRIASPENRQASTFLVDEVDEIFAPKSERSELRGLLNAGFHRGDCAIRMVGEGAKQEAQKFPVFCPKLLAGKNSAALGDTLESRCIRIELKRKTRQEQVERFRRREVSEEAREVRELLSMLAERHLDGLAQARPELPEQLTDRQWDVWEPLLGLAELAGGKWPSKARASAVVLTTGAESDESLGVRLLADCREVFNGHERISTTHLIEILCLLEEAPWGEKWWDAYKGERKPGAASNLAWHLRRYGIRSKKIRFEEGPLMGYEREQLEDAFNRYLSPLEGLTRNNRNNPHEQSDWDQFESRNNTPDVPAQEQSPKPHGHSDVPVVPAEKPQEGQGALDLGTAPLDEIRRGAEAGLL